MAESGGKGDCAAAFGERCAERGQAGGDKHGAENEKHTGIYKRMRLCSAPRCMMR